MTKGDLAVSIVCANAKTLEGLRSYLGNAGVRVHATEEIAPQPSSVSAIVFFPDEFPKDAVKKLHAKRLLLVVVTQHPQQFEKLENVIVIPKPAFGWTILDAIRGWLERP